MPMTIPTLAQALQAMGNAHVYVGDPFTLNGMVALGQKDGAVDVAFSEEFSDLTAPEITGASVHQSTLRGVGLTVTIPLIMGDDTIWAKISPSGTKGGGRSNPIAAVTTAVLIAPDSEVTPSPPGLGYNGTVWTPAAPKNSIWIWRARASRGGLSFTSDNGGKVVMPVTFTGMFYGANPEDHKIYTIGDPIVQGISAVRI